MRRPTLSICIPSKDRHFDVLRCLNSIRNQSVQPDEILIIDQSVRPYDLPAMPGIKHWYQPALSGLAAAKNFGAHSASSEVVLFLDDDVELLPGCLAALLAAFARHPEAAGMSAAVAKRGEALHWWDVHTWLFCRGFFNAAARRKRGLIELRRLQGCALAAQRAVLLQEPEDENLIGYSYGEDWELSHRLGRHGKLLLASDAKLLHHVSRQNRYGVRQLQRDRWDNFLYFYEKLDASRFFLNRFWRLWWMLGESILWLKEGMGLPFLGLQSADAPKRSESLRTRERDSRTGAP